MIKKNMKKQQKQTTKFRFTKADLITQIAQKAEVTMNETESFYNIFEKVLIEAIANYPEVTLSPNLGKFVLTTIPAGRLTNIHGKKISYPASTSVRFKISKTLRKVVKHIKLA